MDSSGWNSSCNREALPPHENLLGEHSLASTSPVHDRPVLLKKKPRTKKAKGQVLQDVVDSQSGPEQDHGDCVSRRPYQERQETWLRLLQQTDLQGMPAWKNIPQYLTSEKYYCTGILQRFEENKLL